MHYLSREIILHVWCRWWCFLRPFRRNKGQIFQPIAHGMAPKWGTEICILIRFGTYRFHRYRCHVGTGFRYPTLLLRHSRCYVLIRIFFSGLFYSRDLQKEEETMVFEAHCMSFPWTEILLFNYAKIKTVFYSMAPLINIILCEIVKCKTTVEMSGLVHDNGNFYKGCTT